MRSISDAYPSEGVIKGWNFDAEQFIVNPSPNFHFDDTHHPAQWFFSPPLLSRRNILQSVNAAPDTASSVSEILSRLTLTTFFQIVNCLRLRYMPRAR
jgi:hypothetical protein